MRIRSVVAPALFFCFAVACQSGGEGGRRVLRSFRIEVGHSDGHSDFKGRRETSQSTYVGGSFAPFMYLAEAPTADFAATEAAYRDLLDREAAERASNPPVELPSHGASGEAALSSDVGGGGQSGEPTVAEPVALPAPAPPSSIPPLAADGGLSFAGGLGLLMSALGAIGLGYATWPYWGGALWSKIGLWLKARKKAAKK